MTTGPADWISIRSAELSAEINPFGAQLSTLRDRAGRDLLWDGEAAVWNGRAPLLFPIVGTLAGGQYRIGTKTYKLSRHGFARGMPFRRLASDPATATFRLEADSRTREVYPFEFELDVSFTLWGPALSVKMSVRNTGQEDLPASFGYHPAFRWPLPYGQPREAHFIEFEATESATIRRLNSDGLLAPEGHPTPIRDRRLNLVDDLFKDDVVILDELRSRSVTYGAQSGPRIRVSYPDATYLGFWSKPGAGFVCIEPWQGISDPAGFDGDFAAKPGVFTVPPGGVRSIEMLITLLVD